MQSSCMEIEVVEIIESLDNALSLARSNNLTIGFVPTMGALHEGHCSLIKASVKRCDVTVCSIFVNPTQFNNSTDLENYPRDLARDLDIIKDLGCDIVFVPDDKIIYPVGTSRKVLGFNIDRLENIMEGKFRPGHFDGVATVVNTLFNIVQPNLAFFGIKDYQQQVVIKQLVAFTNNNIEIVTCDTVREENGLAMSSRNRLLSPDNKKEAAIIYRQLQFAKDKINQLSVTEIINEVRMNWENSKLELEYFEIVDGTTLETVNHKDNHKHIVACVAAYIDEVRLIDNMTLFS